MAILPGTAPAEHVFRYKNLEFSCPACLASVSRKKNIVFTSILGMNGTIKEIVGADDYQITFTGIITGANGQRPQAEIDKLKAFLDLTDLEIPIDIISPWLNDIFGIYSVQIESYELPQEPGGWSYQRFTINAICDAPLVLKNL